MKLSAILAPMIAAGVSGDVILATVKAFEEAQEATADQSKEKARARWRKWKEGQPINVGKRLQTTANVSSPLTRADPSLSTLEIAGKEESKKDTSPSARSRGERIPTDFIPDIEWAGTQGLPVNEATIEANQFTDYWRSKPGKDGLKLDWPGTWRMWVRNAIKRRGRPPPGKRTYSDVISDRLDEDNGTEGIFGTRSDAQRFSPRLIESRPHDEDLRGGIAGRVVRINR